MADIVLTAFSRNQPKSLSGIETSIKQTESSQSFVAGINLNPYQGLKQLY